MPKAVLLDEFHVSVVVPAGLRKSEVTAALRTLRSKRLHACLFDAVRRVFQRYRSLRRARVSISR